MRMIGYLGGDANTLVVRKAEEEDLRLAVELEDINKMLAVVVFQTGEIALGVTEIRGGQDVLQDMVLVGEIDTEDPDMPIDIYDKTTWLKTQRPVIEFTRTRVRGDNDD